MNATHKLSKIALVLAAFTYMAVSVWSAHATTLSGTLTADNAFTAYLSTDDSVLGNPIVSGNNWPTDYAFPATALVAGVTNYLHVIAQDQGEVFMFMGQFSLSDANFQFLNGTQSLLTNLTDWKANLYSGSWVAPTGSPYSYGTNPFCCTPWGRASMTGATFIWASGGTSFSAAEFSTPIISNVAATPVPAALPLFATGLGALACLVRRRKQKATALAA